MSDTILCGLTCKCDELPSGQKLCALAHSPDARRVMAEAAGMRVDEKSNETYDVIVRVNHRNSKGEDKAHAVYPVLSTPLDAAKSHAEAFGRFGVWDNLTFYPPHRVLGVRLSPNA